MTDITTVACPYCAEHVQAAAKKCRHCGELIDSTMREMAAMREIAALRSTQPQQVFMNAAVSPSVPAGYMRPAKSKAVAAVFALLLGGIGIHKFYLGRNGAGIVYILFCWTLIPGLIAFFEGLGYLFMGEDAFHHKYG